MQDKDQVIQLIKLNLNNGNLFIQLQDQVF